MNAVFHIEQEDFKVKPNLFQIATKELSQDGFFTWLIQWADESNENYDSYLRSTAVSFLELMLENKHSVEIKKIIAYRQWNSIDILVEINGNTIIAIEDKTNTGEHSKQLERYKQLVINHYKDKMDALIFIYLKTGNESIATISKVIEKGYKVIDRKSILEVLNKSESTNDILVEFRDNLNSIEFQTNSCNTVEGVVSNWRAAEGFYLKLQEMILPEWSDWRYVPNQMGGFLGFWYNWISTNDYDLWIQIENSFERGIKLVIKIGECKINLSRLYSVLSELKGICEDESIVIQKPNRYRSGGTSTLAEITNAFTIYKNQEFDIGKFRELLRKIENILEIHSLNKRNEKMEDATIR